MKNFHRMFNLLTTTLTRDPMSDHIVSEQYDIFDSERYHVIKANIDLACARFGLDLAMGDDSSCVTISNPANGAFTALPAYESTLNNLFDVIQFINQQFPNNQIFHFDETVDN